jgi:nitrogen fixation protein FixH
MNWGFKIILAYLTFVACILVLVYKANSSHFDLVEPKYYEAELAYQDRIDASERTALLKEAPKVMAEKGALKIIFPGAFAGNTIKGQVLLYYPADANKDKTYTFEVQDSLLLNIGAKASGWYRVKLDWRLNQEKYYYETGIHL